MALNSKTGASTRNSMLNIFDALNSGKYGGFDGAQPTDADTALGAQVLLFECTFGGTAFAAASAASKTANSITADSSANATGTLAWGSLYASARTSTGINDHSASTSGANLNVNSTGITSGANVSITSLVITMAA